MAYDLASIRNRVMEDKLDDTSYDPDIIDRFINDAQRDLWSLYELPFMEKSFTGLIAAGEHIFSFPEDYQQEQMLLAISPDTSVRDMSKLYVPLREFFQAYPLPSDAEAGAPYWWTMHANKMYLNHPTDQQYTLRLFYIKTPDILEDDADVPEPPEMFEEALVLGAYRRVLQRNEDYDVAAAIQQEYDGLIERLPIRYAKRQTGNTMRMGQPYRVVRPRRV